MEGMRMEGRAVTSLIVRKVEPSSARDGNGSGEGGKAAAVSLTALPPLLQYQKRKITRE